MKDGLLRIILIKNNEINIMETLNNIIKILLLKNNKLSISIYIYIYIISQKVNICVM